MQGIEKPEAAGTVLAGVGLMRHRVHPPLGVDGRMRQEALSPEDLAIDNLNSGELLAAWYLE